MIENPFTPVFGGKPDFFFGREGVLSRFDRALVDRGSEDRALFVTGTRGSGKTALLEQLSSRAKKRGWEVVDLGPEGAVHARLRRLAGYDEETKTVDPRVSVSILGSGGSLGGVATSKTTHVDESDLDLLLIDACARARAGVMVTLDEVQKLAEHEVSVISNAFQMASRKGCDAILVVAGLPFSHAEVIKYSGCTFMRRAVHEKIGLLSRDEVEGAFDAAFEGQVGLSLPEGALEALVNVSMGHPYMVQLLGYYLVEIAGDKVSGGGGLDVTRGDVDRACAMAKGAYQSRALRPMVDELPAGERNYLRSMAQLLDSERTAESAEVAKRLGKDVKQASPLRDKLLKAGLIVAAGRGKLMFAVPYLADYLIDDGGEDTELSRIRSWGV